MIDPEVERLRRLRATALRVRSVGHALSRSRVATADPLFRRGACAAWRVARAVSGRLRAHPFVEFQRDAALSVLTMNSLAAKVAVVSASSRLKALKVFERQIKSLSRQLDDARALAWSSDLSETLARSQVEMRALAIATEHALFEACERYAQATQASVPVKLSATTYPAKRLTIQVGSGSSSDWPFIAL